MQTIVSGASTDVSSIATVSSEADRYCDCPAAPANGPTHANAVNCATGTCSGYGQPRTYVRVRGGQNFRTFGTYPLIPNSIGVGQRAFRRVQ